jgi:hypothetical protein
MMDKPDYVIELRTIARLIETKALVTWQERMLLDCAKPPTRSSGLEKSSKSSPRRT